MEASNPYAAPATEVRDIDPAGEAQPLAGRLARLGAYLLDGLVGALIIYVPALVAIGGPFNVMALRDTVDDALLVRAGIALLLGALVYLGITIYLVVKYRQTIGKRMVGIKVVRKDGSRVSLSRLFWLRNLVPGLLTVIPYAGMVFAILDLLVIFRASRQCLHDQIADTIVVTA